MIPSYYCYYFVDMIQVAKNNKYLLCDASKLVTLTPKESHVFDMKRDNYYMYLHQLTLMKLEYFNIAKQSFNFAQFILYSDDIITFDEETVLVVIEWTLIEMGRNLWL